MRLSILRNNERRAQSVLKMHLLRSAVGDEVRASQVLKIMGRALGPSHFLYAMYFTAQGH